MSLMAVITLAITLSVWNIVDVIPLGTSSVLDHLFSVKHVFSRKWISAEDTLRGNDLSQEMAFNMLKQYINQPHI